MLYSYHHRSGVLNFWRAGPKTTLGRAVPLHLHHTSAKCLVAVSTAQAICPRNTTDAGFDNTANLPKEYRLVLFTYFSSVSSLVPLTCTGRQWRHIVTVQSIRSSFLADRGA